MGELEYKAGMCIGARGMGEVVGEIMRNGETDTGKWGVRGNWSTGETEMAETGRACG